MAELLASLTSETLGIVTFFCIGTIVAGIIVSISGVWSSLIKVSWSDLANLWSAWVVVTASGLMVVFMAVATGLFGTGVARAIAYAVERARTGNDKPFGSFGAFPWGDLLLLIGMTAIAASLFAAVAGVAQSAILRGVIDRPVTRWVTGNMQAWTAGIATSLLVAVLMGQLVGLWGFNGALLLGGIITGRLVGDKVTSAGLELIRHERYEQFHRTDEAVPQPPRVLPLIASTLVLLIVLIPTLLAATMPPGTPQESVAQTIVEAPTVEPAPTVIPTPTIPASTFCDGIEQMHPSDTYVCVGSEAGDRIGAGGNWVMTAEASDFQSIRATSREVIVGIQEGNSPWTLIFAAPPGRLLTPGMYENAVSTYRWDTNELKSMAMLSEIATLEVTSRTESVRPCTGRFEVLVFDHDGEADGYDPVNTARFAANFEQECDDSHATLYGTIRINIAADDLE